MSSEESLAVLLSYRVLLFEPRQTYKGALTPAGWPFMTINDMRICENMVRIRALKSVNDSVMDSRDVLATVGNRSRPSISGWGWTGLYDRVE